MLLIFDWDGTIANTEWLISIATARLAGSIGLKISPEFVHENFSGKSSRDKFLLIANELEAPITEQQIETLEAKHRIAKKDIYSRITPENLFPGATVALDEIHRTQKHTLVVCSNGEQDSLVPAVTNVGLAGYFNYIYTPDLPRMIKKPNPAMILQAMSDAKTSTQQTAMFGDTATDMQAASNAQLWNKIAFVPNDRHSAK